MVRFLAGTWRYMRVLAYLVLADFAVRSVIGCG